MLEQGRPHRLVGAEDQRLRRPAHRGPAAGPGPGRARGGVHRPPEPPEQPLCPVRRGPGRPHPVRPRPRGPHPPAGDRRAHRPSGSCGRPTPPDCTIWTTARWWSPGGWGTSSPVSGCSTGRMCPGGAGVGPVRTLWVGRSEAALGAQRPGGPRPGGGPHFSRRNGERGPGGKPPGPQLYSPLAAARSFWESLSLIRQRAIPPIS